MLGLWVAFYTKPPSFSAIMLGRLRMNLDDCIKVYCELLPRITKTSKSLLTFGVWSALTLKGRYDSRQLVNLVRIMLEQQGLQTEASLEELNPQCRVCVVRSFNSIQGIFLLIVFYRFVCATRVESMKTCCFRSYQVKDSSEDLTNVKIWEATRATMASPTYYDPIKIGAFGAEFIDGGIGANNPVRILLQEARRVWSYETIRDSLGCIVSIGSGKPLLHAIGNTTIQMAKSLVNLATDSEKEAESFLRDHPELAEQFFRFNVSHGLERIVTDDWKQHSLISALTYDYIQTATVRADLYTSGRQLESSREWPWSHVKDLDESYASRSIAGSDSGYSSGSSFFKSNLEFTAAVDDLFNLFAKDPELEPLYTIAIQKIGSARFQKNILTLLKRYCNRLRTRADNDIERSTVKFLRTQSRPLAVRLTSHYRLGNDKTALTDNSQPNMKEPTKPESSAVKQRLETTITLDNVAERAAVDRFQEEEKDDDEVCEDDIDPLDEEYIGFSWDVLTSGETFNKLRKDLWRFIMQDSRISRPSYLASNLSPRTYIHDAIEPWFPANLRGPHRLTINVYWEVLKFLERELDEGKSLKALLTLSGTESSAYAAACVDYMTWMGPTTAQIVLEALLDALALEKDANTYSEHLMPSYLINVNLELDIPRRADRLISIKVYEGDRKKSVPERAELVLNGSPAEIIEIVNQIAWLGLVFRSPVPGQLVHADFTLEQSALLQFDLTYSPNQRFQACHDLCWPPLFLGFVMAKGFPIPPRDDEVGVELPFDLMASLANIAHPVICDGGFVLRGYSSIIYPVSGVSSSLPSGSVQWHALHASANERSISLKTIENRQRIRTTNLDEFEALSACRTFLGYSAETRVCLGTKEADYRESRRPQGNPLGPQKGRFVFKGLSANLNGSHFVGGGFTSNWDYHRSKSAEIKDRAQTSYEAILSDIVDEPSILYDVQDCRGWLVPEICVILHMMHIRASNWAQKGTMPTLKNKIPFTDGGSDASGKPSAAALKAILKDAQDPELYVSVRGNEKCHLSAWVTEFWAVIDAIKTDMKNDKPADRAGLVGWIFEDVVIKGSTCGERRETIKRFQGNWKRLVNEAGVVVFHGMGYGEIIKSIDPICSVWRSPPTGEDLLIASIESVIELQKLVGKRFAPLSNFKVCGGDKFQWPNENSFRCNPGEQDECFRLVHTIGNSDRLLDITDSSCSRGAVAFGKMKKRYHPDRTMRGLEAAEPQNPPDLNQAPAAIPDAPDGLPQPAAAPPLEAATPAAEPNIVANGHVVDGEHPAINIYLVETRQQEEPKADYTVQESAQYFTLDKGQLINLASAAILLLSLLIHVILWILRL